MKDQHQGDTGQTTLPRERDRQTKPTEVKVLLKYLLMDQQNKTTTPNLHNLLTHGLSDTENYYFERAVLNRSLSVHYLGGKNQKGRGQEGVVCHEFGVCPKKKKLL